MTGVQQPQRCFICGEENPNALQEHHNRPRAAGGTDEPENTTLLCGNCHDAVHKLYDVNQEEDHG